MPEQNQATSASGEPVFTLSQLRTMLDGVAIQEAAEAEWQHNIEEAIGNGVATGRFVVAVASIDASGKLTTFQSNRGMPVDKLTYFMRDLLTELLK